jgi:hypothetical protein
LFEIEVADTQHSRPAAVVDGFHRPPRGPIVRGQPRRTRRPMQQVGYL